MVRRDRTVQGTNNLRTYKEATMASCAQCDYTGKGKLNWVGMLLWIVIGFLVILSFFIWPLFLLWPLMAIAMILFPIGRMCPECKKPLQRGAASG
jgi:hypothetical protein